MTRNSVRMVALLFFAAVCPNSSVPAKDRAPQLTELEPMLVAICRKPDISTIMGTGFLVSGDGLVITADHVITDGSGRVHKSLYAIRPMHPDAQAYRLEPVHRFRESLQGRDVAILRMVSDPPLKNLPFLRIGGGVSTGDELVVAGFPKVFAKPYVWPLLRRGIVASTRYTLEGFPILVVDITSVKRFSGSPLISLQTGRVVGVLRGATHDRTTDFSVGTPIEEADLAAGVNGK